MFPYSDAYVTFTFQEFGYVSDADKDSLDADALLEAIWQGTEKANSWALAARNGGTLSPLVGFGRKRNTRELVRSDPGGSLGVPYLSNGVSNHPSI